MPLLVDGDNLLGTWPGRRRTDRERRSLSFELARLAVRTGRRVVVVFDGPAPAAGQPDGEAIFAGPGRSADEVLLARLGGESDRHGWTVVTSDRSLGDRCRALGARVLRCDRFRPQLAPDPTDEKPAREMDVERWLSEFGES